MCISALKNFFVFKKYSLHAKNSTNNLKPLNITPNEQKTNLVKEGEKQEEPLKIFKNNKENQDEEDEDEEIRLL